MSNGSEELELNYTIFRWCLCGRTVYVGNRSVDQVKWLSGLDESDGKEHMLHSFLSFRYCEYSHLRYRVIFRVVLLYEWWGPRQLWSQVASPTLQPTRPLRPHSECILDLSNGEDHIYFWPFSLEAKRSVKLLDADLDDPSKDFLDDGQKTEISIFADWDFGETKDGDSVQKTESWQVWSLHHMIDDAKLGVGVPHRRGVF